MLGGKTVYEDAKAKENKGKKRKLPTPYTSPGRCRSREMCNKEVVICLLWDVNFAPSLESF